MRSLEPAAALVVFGLGTAVSSASLAADPAALERAWHGCVRDAFAHQPQTQSKPGSQRNALDACKEHEDAFVAAMTAEATEDEAAPGAGKSLPARAGAWAASVTATIVDPVAHWIEMLRR